MIVEPVAGPRFDVLALQEAYSKVRRHASPQAAARDDDVLRSISLTHRSAAADPLYDGNNSQFSAGGRKIYQERDFDTFNDIFRSTYFFEIYRALPFRAGRVRLICLPALTVYGMHRDATKRAHVAVVTNPESRLVFEDGSTFHVPLDGRMYIVDTRTPHTAFNAGRTDRIHLVISLADSETPTSQEARDALSASVQVRTEGS